MNKRLVIALGGNALGNNPKEQLELVKNTAATIVDLVEEGYDVVIGHGNGPQVGMVNLAFEYAHNNDGKTPAMPFPECGAMTQGYIGYHLQQAVQRELAARGINKPCAAIVTQVVVDPNDAAFQHPTKPVGMFYSKEVPVVAIAAWFPRPFPRKSWNCPLWSSWWTCTMSSSPLAAVAFPSWRRPPATMRAWQPSSTRTAPVRSSRST